MLLYTIIARSSDGMVLVESTLAGVTGNHTQVTHQLLQKLTANPHLVPIGNRKTFSNNFSLNPSNVSNNFNSYGDVEMKSFWNGSGTEEIYDMEEEATISLFFHVKRSESVLFICLSDDTSSQEHRINFAFLQDVQKEFTQKYKPNKILKANAYGMEKGFNRTLATMMHHCNTNRNLGKDTKTTELHSEVESIKRVLGNNITLMIRRQDYILGLIDTTEDLLADAKIFQKKGRKLEKAVKRKKWLYVLILAAFGILTIYFMIAEVCGYDLSCAGGEQAEYGDDAW